MVGGLSSAAPRGGLKYHLNGKAPFWEPLFSSNNNPFFVQMIITMFSFLCRILLDGSSDDLF